MKTACVKWPVFWRHLLKYPRPRRVSLVLDRLFEKYRHTQRLPVVLDSLAKDMYFILVDADEPPDWGWDVFEALVLSAMATREIGATDDKA